VFVVGPTGVGKTTTVAKLAAGAAMYERSRVLLISADNYRIGAEAQLRTYAEIMGLPLVALQSDAELAAAIEAHSQCNLVFVDTAGRSQRNAEGLRETAELIAAVPVHQREVHLVVAAGTREREMHDVARAFASLRPDALLITKLDEALCYGPLLGLVERCGHPLSYLANGQAVPEDIEVASPNRLAEMILRGY
jgi:flagellar biosynthesis protein FlhF